MPIKTKDMPMDFCPSDCRFISLGLDLPMPCAAEPFQLGVTGGYSRHVLNSVYCPPHTSPLPNLPPYQSYDSVDKQSRDSVPTLYCKYELLCSMWSDKNK